MMLNKIQTFQELCCLNKEAMTIFSMAAANVTSPVLRENLMERSIRHLQFLESLKDIAPVGTNIYTMFSGDTRAKGKMSQYMNRMLELQLDRATENAANKCSYMVYTVYEKICGKTFLQSGKLANMIREQKSSLWSEIESQEERDMLFV